MLVSPARAGGQQLPAPYLAEYPYLFVRETAETDYLCTVCQQTLKESQLHSHLFQGHSALTLQDSFVRLRQTRQLGGEKTARSIACVVCWAKMDSENQMKTHRISCKNTFSEENVNMREHMDPASEESPPDMEDMGEEDDRETNGVSPPPFPQPEVILDTEVGVKYEPSDEQGYFNHHKFDLMGRGEPVYTSQCMQCSLCSMILPSSSYLSHLRAYHRVTCPLSNLTCPLCMTCVPIMDLTVHLASQHGLVPQSAVNALLLWVLTSNTFSLNDAAQESLKSKFKQSPLLQSKVRTQASSSTPLNLKSSPSTQTTTSLKQSQASRQLEIETPLINDLRGKVPVEQLMGKLTRSHLGAGGKESHQCLVCAKWYAIPPLKHMRSHIITFRLEKRKIVQLSNNTTICLICYRILDSHQTVAGHIASHNDQGSSSPGSGVGSSNHITIPGLPGGSMSHVPASLTGSAGGLLAEALLGLTKDRRDNDDLPLGATYETAVQRGVKEEVNVELDNAGRVKSGKVRKQCELCGEWSNIKWFFKHMSEVHQALFCRCCREYLPKDEHKEHRHWHGMPPYMGQKIRIEVGQPIIIDRKERASLTPIGSLAAWGGSSGGLVVKAVDEMKRKRKVERASSPNGSIRTSGSSTNGDSSFQHGRDSLMPKERCPVCAIEITHKNLARHIKLRHGIKYKFCYKCRKLVPADLYNEHKELHESGELPSLGGGLEYLDSLQGGEDGVIEIPEEVLDEVMDSNSQGVRRKDDIFRANTSLTKLESLMGKEFKHPRRQCNICGYSVSYSNYKRHLRNAHPGIVDKDDSTGEGEGDMVGHHMDDCDRIDDNRGMSGEEEEGEEVRGEEGEDGYTECLRCGDHVMSEFMENHLKMMHGESTAGSARPRNYELRACPECGVEMRADTVTKHCRVKHKVVYKHCSACSKFIPKKLMKVHTRLHEKGELEGRMEDLKVEGRMEDLKVEELKGEGRRKGVKGERLQVLNGSNSDTAGDKQVPGVPGVGGNHRTNNNEAELKEDNSSLDKDEFDVENKLVIHCD